MITKEQIEGFYKELDRLLAARLKEGYLETTLADKDATIKRLQDKLAVTGEVMQKNEDLETEVMRLHGHRHNAEETCNVLRNQVDQLTKARDAWKDAHVKLKTVLYNELGL